MKLIIEDDDGRKTVVPFARDEISIGRRDGNTIRLTERNVSRRHARLTRNNGHVFIEDLGSYNGVKINGDRVQGRAEVKEGDLIEIGDYNLAIQLDATDALHATGGDGAALGTASATDGQDIHSVPTGPQKRPHAPPPPAEPITETAHIAPGPVTTEPQAKPMQPRPAPSTDQPIMAPAEAGSPPSTAEPASPAPAHGVIQARVGEDRAAPSRAESTAVIRVDIDALNRSDERRPLSPEDRPRLVGLSGEFAGRSFDVEHTSVSIGRTVDNDVAIDHRSLSRHHCKVFLDKDGSWKVLDRGSANGVRVNGEEYGLIDLRRGDVVELGHVKMRFCDPGDPFVYTEESRKAHAVPPRPSGMAARRRRGIAPIVAAVAGVGALAALVAFIVTGGLSRDEDSTIPTAPPETSTVQDSVREAIQAAGDAAENEQWEQARAAYQQALNLDPTNAVAAQGLAHVEGEAAAKAHFEAAVAAVRSRSWEDAWHSMSSIPSDSVYARRIDEHRDAIHEGYLSILMDRARNALRASDWNDAIAEAEAILALEPGHSGASELRARAEQSQDRQERELALAAEERRKRTTATRTKQRQAPRRPQKTAPATKEAPDNRQEAQEAYETGSAHVRSNEFRQAITHLERAIRLDPRGQSRAHALLGTCYARLGDSERAAMHYRRFLDTNPNHPQAPQVEQILQDFERYRQ